MTADPALREALAREIYARTFASDDDGVPRHGYANWDSGSGHPYFESGFSVAEARRLADAILSSGLVVGAGALGDAAREALRLAAPHLLLLIEMESEDDQEGVDAVTVAALRAIVAILPDALDGAPEWIRQAVADTARASPAVDGRIGRSVDQELPVADHQKVCSRGGAG